MEIRSLPQFLWEGYTQEFYGSSLYCFENKGITTFIDDEKLERGRYISPNLLQAIEESRYAIVVLSRNYASSRWCLLELVKIVESMEKTGLKIFTIFYYVDPSHVRHQTNCFAEAFAELEKDSRIVKEDVQTWKAALRKVGNSLGWDLRDVNESTTIEGIVEMILKELNSRVSTISKDLIGIVSRVEELENLCFNDRPGDDVRFVGIWGMGGIGKTTLAHAFYDRFSSKFEASCFIADVRERTGKDGLNCLQNELLSHILMESNIDIKNVDMGKNTIRLRLCYKKVLVILDDVDQSKQLEALANKRNWFGPGSNIIITTRDLCLLIGHRLAENEICRAKILNNYEALCLFSWKAFEEELPPEEFLELSKKILNHANGLPLALEVLGSFFGSLLLPEGSADIWESALSKLKEYPDETIMKTLRISFDGLAETEKNIFLEIACFYKGKDSDRVKGILESCGYHPNIGIKVLISKSLITLRGRKLWMHDLLEEMGREIIRRESPEEPGQRSRLWHDEDILHVLKSNSGTKKILGIFLSSPPQEELHLSSDVFSRMKNLRLLKMSRNVHLSQGLSYLSSELRAMEWNGYPLKSLPMGFSPNKLVELNMHCSHIVQPWQGIKCLGKLKLIDLSNSQYLIETPDFTGAPNLERLILQGCTKLLMLHSSVGFLKRLASLNLRGCKSLLSLPTTFHGLASLKTLTLSGCSKLEKMPEDVGSLEHLEELDVSETAIRQVPSSVLLLQNLKMLSFRGCSGLPPRSLFSPLLTWFLPSPALGLVLPPLISGLCNLNKLDLSYCHLTDGAVPDDLSCLSSLHFLDLSGNDFTLLPERCISQLSKLKHIFLRLCSRLRSIPALPSSVKYVMAEECLSLETHFDEIDAWFSEDNEVTYFTTRTTRQSNGGKIGRFSILAAHVDLMEERTIKDNIDLALAISGTSRAATIPIWFLNQNRGSSIRLQLDLDDSRKWLGFALYFVFEIRDLESWEATRFSRLDVPLDREDFDQLEFHFETNEGLLKDQLEQEFPKCPIDTPAGYWLYVPRIWFEKKSNEVDTWTYIEVSITIGSPFMEVEMCGARLAYKQNAHEFIDAVKFLKKENVNICDGKCHFKISQTSPRSSNPSSSRFCFVNLVMPENVGEVESSGCNLLDKDFISNEILEYTSKKKDLQSFLFRCYEVSLSFLLILVWDSELC